MNTRSKNKKRAKKETELQELLSPLMDSDEPLDVSLLASHIGKLSVKQETTLAHAAAKHLELFEKHIGPYQDVIANATRHVKNLFEDEWFCQQTGYSPVNPERYYFPKYVREVVGPRPDPCKWVGMFFGRERGDKVKEDLKKANNIQAYVELFNTFNSEPEALPVLDLMKNILSYLREESRTADSEEMLRFSCLYGLSGAMDDVLAGKYGPVNGVTIDSPLSFRERDELIGDERCFFSSFYPFDAMFMPAWAFGAALGYRNVVHHCIHILGASTDAKLVLRMKESGDMKDTESLPSLMLYWAITANQPEMVTYLVTECGFQFRWISDVMDDLFSLLFHLDGVSDECGVWRSTRYDPDEFMFERSAQRKFRAKCCYEEKQKMLRTMIEAGLPFNLLVPQINLKVEKRIIKFMDDGGYVKRVESSKVQKFFDKLSTTEAKARESMYHASAAFNVVQYKEKDKLSLLDFYKRLVKMWKRGADSTQQARRAKREELDPRWKLYDDIGDEAFASWWAGKSEEDSDHDSDY